MVDLPAPFSEIPRVRLLFNRPSDIEPLERLRNCSSGLAFGGNKVRKLEYVLADALAQGADTLVTTGGIKSNHMRQTAAAAARLGLKVALYKALGNTQINDILGAETFPIESDESHVLKTLWDRGQKPYSIPTVLEQEKQLGYSFDVIVAVAGSGSTLGGMVAGFKLAQMHGFPGSKKRIVGFMIGDATKREMSDLDDYELHDEYLGGAYGNLNKATADGIRTFARLEGIITDPVYTGKAVTGMMDFGKVGKFKGSKVLFCHTGGQASISAYPQLH
ncbi:tryptophan synthase beta subunit-like PLP-dependent enzyme [Thozetella sp. PMI_491]|nr:tryptophan synthase beta subunit-like PLP-dependent enzyme [Thozetella sp. PMI_491]